MAKELPPGVATRRERFVIYLDRRIQVERETLDVLSKLVRPQEAARQVFCAAVLDASRAGTLPVLLHEDGVTPEVAREVVAPAKTMDQAPVAAAATEVTATEDMRLVPVINPSAAAEALGPKFAGITNIFGTQSKIASGEQA